MKDEEGKDVCCDPADSCAIKLPGKKNKTTTKPVLCLSKEWFQAKHILYCTFEEVINISSIVIAWVMDNKILVTANSCSMGLKYITGMVV